MTTSLIDLQTIPNQEFNITINNINMTINLRMAGENSNPIMLFSLQIDNEYVCSCIPCFANQGILPYKYMQSIAGGNFYFITNDENYPNYEDFGTTCFLYFISEDEIN